MTKSKNKTFKIMRTKPDKQKNNLEPDINFKNKIFSFKTIYESFIYFYDQYDKATLSNENFLYANRNLASAQSNILSDINKAKKEIVDHYLKEIGIFAEYFNDFKNYRSQKYLNKLYPKFEFELKAIAMSNNTTLPYYLSKITSITPKNLETMLHRSKEIFLLCNT